MFRKVMQMIQNYAEKKLLDEVFATYLDVQDAAAEMAQVLPCPRCGKLTMKISNLKIYDRPLDLRELTGLQETRFGMRPVEITNPPQSWRYVEDAECTS